MIVFENDIFPRQIAAQPGAGRSKADPSVAAKGAIKASARGAGGPPATGFQIVFEAEARSLAPRPGATTASPAQSSASANSGFQLVFEAETLPPLPPSQSQSASTSTTGAAGGKPGQVPLWDNGGFGFSDILDVINPLQHMPIISTIYRAETGDKIGAIPRILGSILFGGGLIGAAVGAATAVVNLAVEQETGRDIGAHIYAAIFGGGGRNAKSTTIASNPTLKAAATATAVPLAATAKPKNLLVAPRAASTSAAITPASAKAKPVPTPPAPAPLTQTPTKTKPAPTPAANVGPPRGSVRVTGKDAPPKSLEGAAGKAVSSQFRRSTWYRKNQDILAAQARELVRAKAAAQARATKSTGAGASGPQAKTAVGKPDMLRLFTGKAAAGYSSVGGVKSKSTIIRPAPIPKAAMAAEMSKAMAKYEQLLKSRIAANTQVNKVR
ncbi:MAG: hypothetical protein O7I42_07600 [Alphaproteobacteria bacterium]|nr:hypothetical protein [Alphaproteobacteria bacterium]